MRGSSARLIGIAIFVLAGLGLFAVGLFMIGARQLAFTPKFTVYTEFAKLNGLETGATVRVSGMKAGEVSAIRLPSKPGEKFRLQLEIRDDLHPLVRQDSVASIETEGLVGGTFLEVAGGTPAAPALAPGGTMPSREPFGFAELFQELGETVALINDTVRDIRGNVVRIVGSVADVAEHTQEIITTVGRDLERIAAAGVRVAGDVRHLADDVRAGKGTIGKLFTDDELYRQVTAVMTTASQIAERVRDVVGEAKDLIAKLQGTGGRVQGMVANLQETLDSARTALGDMSDAMDALKHNFLLRGFFHERGYFDLSQLSPAEYRAGVLAHGNRQRLRIWLKADVLFRTTADGGEVLTDGGKARIDSAMAGYLPYLPDAVLMVEGYARQGSRAQQFLRARDRAALVRAYLIDRFHLDPRTTGLMPLGAEASGTSPDGRTWDGVALSLFVERGRLNSGG
ncbi:MAG: MCE family protein [Acidobacteriota bacterium]|nr:MCE family protein [Acidobacteriota bacterium]